MNNSALEFHVALNQVRPPVRRTLLLPRAATFWDLLDLHKPKRDLKSEDALAALVVEKLSAESV